MDKRMVQVKRPTSTSSSRQRYLFVVLGICTISLCAVVWHGSSSGKNATPSLRKNGAVAISSHKSPDRVDSKPLADLPSTATAADPNASKHELEGYSGEIVQLRSAVMPAIGYGTCCRPTAKGQDIYDSTLVLLKEGGRLIDTAMAYGNHVEIGKAVTDSQIPRQQVWITSKISPNKIPHRSKTEDLASNTLKSVHGILEELNLGGDGRSYLDLCLIHTQKLGREATVEIWKGLVEAKEKNLVKVIGVSNFNHQEIVDLYEETGVLPEVNQIQYHPWTTPEWKEVVEWQSRNKIATTAYTSLGGSRFHKSSDGTTNWPPVVTALAQKYTATESQILLRWAVQQPMVAVIPGSANPDHIRNNLHLPNFSLTAEESQQLEEAKAPSAWFDPKRGPVKYLGVEASKAWQGDHSVH